MQIVREQLGTYEIRKIESSIRGSKCLFLLQTYGLLPNEVEDLKQNLSPLGLKLIRFPLINWKIASADSVKAANHLPVQLSNYAIIGPQILNRSCLITLTSILKRTGVVLLFGYQRNVWFDATRLLQTEDPVPGSYEALLEAIHLTFSTLSPRNSFSSHLNRLLNSLEKVGNKLK